MLIKHNGPSDKTQPHAAKTNAGSSTAPLPPNQSDVPPLKNKDAQKKANSPKSGDYEVGYGKPPKHTQFKPNKSGNPAGRPKRPKDMLGELAHELTKTVTATVGNKPIKVSQGQLIMMALVRSAMGGNLTAIRLVTGVWGALSVEAGTQSVPTFKDIELLQEILAETLAPQSLKPGTPKESSDA